MSEWAGAFVAVHAAAVAPAVIGVAEFQERFAELDEVLHALVTGGEQAFAGFVAVDDGAGPAAEPGVAAAGGAGVNLDGALAVGGIGVELVKRAVVAAPGIGFLEQVCPDFLGGEELNGVGHPDAGQIGVTTQAVAILAASHCLRAGRTFRPARPQVQDRLAPVAHAAGSRRQ